MAKGTNDKKEVKIEFTAVTDKIDEAMVALSTRFGTLAKSISAGINIASSEIKGKITETNMKLDLTNDKLLLISESTAGLKKTISDGFGSLNNILTSNHAKMDSIVQKLVAMHQQTRNIASANQAVKKTNDDNNNSIDLTYVKLKLVNTAWNFIFSKAREYRQEIIELQKTTGQISSLTGEQSDMITRKTIELSTKTGVSVNEISKSLLEAANNGNTLSNSFEKINAGILLSTKNGQSEGTMIRAIDDIVDSFNITVGKTQAILFGNNLISSKSISLFTSLSKDAQEAGMSAEQFGATLGVLRNEAGITEKSLRTGFKEITNSLQLGGKAAQDNFFNVILPKWNEWDDASKKQIENNMKIKEGGKVLEAWGRLSGVIVEQTQKINTEESAIIARASSTPKTLAHQMNEAWNLGLIAIDRIVLKMDRLSTGSSSLNFALMGFKKILDDIEKAQNLVARNEAIQARDKLVAERDLQIAAKATKRITDGDSASDKIRDARGQSIIQLTTKIIQQNEIIDQLFKANNTTLNETTQIQSHLTQGVQGHLKITKDLVESLRDVKKVNSDFNDEQIKAMKEIQDQFAKDKFNLGKKEALSNEIQALKARLVLIVQEQQASLASGKTEDYRKRLGLERLDVEKMLFKVSDDYNKAVAAESKKSASSAKQNANDKRKDAIDEFEAEKKNIIELRKNGEINDFEAITRLTFIKRILEGQKDVKTKMQDIDNLNKDIGREQLAHQQDLNQKFQIENETRANGYAHIILEEQRYQLIANSKDKQLSKKQELELEKQELEILKKEAIGGTAVNVIMAKTNAIVAEKQRLMLGASKTTIDNLKREEQEAIKNGATQLQQAQKYNRAKEQLDNKEKNEVQNKYNVMGVAATAFASSTTGAMDTLFNKLILNTGSLSHIWGDFFNGLMADIAKALAKMALLGATETILGVGDGPVGSFGAMFFKALGGAHGTTLTGVPGYAMGSPIKGVDSVPAMLSPGEIVLDNNASDMFRSLMKHGMSPNMADMMRSMKGSQGSQPIQVHVHSSPSLLGSREEIIRLDRALNNPVVRSYTDRRKI